MEKKYLLPALNEDIKITAEEGLEQRDDVYDFLIRYLAPGYVSADSVFDVGTSAIPHIYEQMLVFQKAFFESSHPDHHRAVLEWRAVFIIMALKRIKNIPLDLVKIDLTGDSNNPFLAAAAVFKPDDDIVLYNTTWDFIYILILEGKSIGIFSPISVVCPGKNLKVNMKTLERWLRIEKVNGSDTLVLDFDKDGSERISLAEWTRKLHEQIKEGPVQNPQTNARIQSIRQELELMYKEYFVGEGGSECTFKNNIYGAINNSIRKEYNFLNFCCDFEIVDKNLEYLVNRYMSDIFAQYLLVVIYDDKPYAMFDKKNIEKLENIFSQVMKVEDKESQRNSTLISVTESGGEIMPFLALMPLKKQFVTELKDRSVEPDDLIERYSAVYERGKDQIKITLSIRHFPYIFHQYYPRQQWKIIYGRDFPPVYIWPGKQIFSNGWKAYYTYVFLNGSNVKVQIPYASVKQRQYRPYWGGTKTAGEFLIMRSSVFPSFIQFTYMGVSGFLPLSISREEKEDVGGSAYIYADVGRRTTCIKIVKRQKVDDTVKLEQIDYQIPHSLWIAGDGENDQTVMYNFATPSNINNQKSVNENTDNKDRHYFKNILHDFSQYKTYPYAYVVSPFVSGQVLFSDSYVHGQAGKNILSSIDFLYAILDEKNRKQVHIFLEQILMYAIFTSLCADCSYVKVIFLHNMGMNSARLGELTGLWRHALDRVKLRTGMQSVLGEDIASISEYQALTNRVYYKMLQEKQIDYSNPILPENDIYLGVDIGWEKTLLAYMYQEPNGNAGHQDDGSISINNCGRLSAINEQILFGGRNISLLQEGLDFRKYKDILSVFLGLPYGQGDNSGMGKILKDFGKLYQGKPCGADYYYGLFDIITMEVEQRKHVVSKDIYYNKSEVRCYIKMLTYNLLLLFFGIGCFLGKMLSDSKRINGKNIRIYLSGNGAKFIRWISNVVPYQEINEENASYLMIVTMRSTLINMVKEGVRLINGDLEDLNCSILFEEDGKEHLIQGAVFGDIPELYGYSGGQPVIQRSTIDNITNSDRNTFYQTLSEITDDVFGEENISLSSIMQNAAGISLDEIINAIRTNSEEVCREVIELMDKM